MWSSGQEAGYFCILKIDLSQIMFYFCKISKTTKEKPLEKLTFLKIK